MNILEHYIIDVINEEPYEMPMPENELEHVDYVEVTLTHNCYGSKKTETTVFVKDEWERAKAKGYFMR